MRRTIITILSTALVLAGMAAIVNAAGGSDREVAASSSAAKPQKLPQLRRVQAHAAVKCRTVRCLNKKLTQFNRVLFKCQRLVAVTQYSDFAHASGGATTGLDYTGVGDPPSDFFVVNNC